MTTRIASIGSCFRFGLLLLLPLATPQICFADLDTCVAASLEWKVDSADEVYLATVVEDKLAKHGMRFQANETLKSDRPLEAFPHDSVERCRLRNVLQPQSDRNRLGTRWILFVRGSGDSARVSGAISLSNPLESWTLAAITAEGKGDSRVLDVAETVVEKVRARIAKRVPLPGGCDPDVTELQLFGHPRDNLPVARWFGANLLEIDIRIWDSHVGDAPDHDMLVTHLLVPLDVPQGEANGLLTRKDFDQHSINHLPAAVKNGIREDKPSSNSSELLGTWKTERNDHWLTVTLQPQGTMLFRMQAKQGREVPRLHARSDRQTCFGSGYWHRQGDALELIATHLILGAAKEWNACRHRLIHGELASTTATRLEWTEGTRLVRLREPLRAHDYPHAHPWYILYKGWGKERVWTSAHVTIADSAEMSGRPLQHLLMVRDMRRSPPLPFAPEPVEPKSVRVTLGDEGFDPRITLMRAGDTLEFTATGDQFPTDHAIAISFFRNSPRGFCPPLQPPLIYQRTIPLPEPALLPIRCVIHEEERGYLSISDHPFATVTRKDGYGALKGWPIGKQTVRLTHPDYDLREAEVWLDGQRAIFEKGRLEIDIDLRVMELKVIGAKAIR
ncbi:MAG: hypothetical protein AAF989_07260 [Planctomycetota bacterium]